jgi:predicted nucleic acid-binding protein
MDFLLDANVVSELRKSAPDPNVLAWQRRHATASAFLSVLVVGEIRQGIERLRPRDGRRAEVLDDWLAGLVNSYRDRILPITAAIAEEWGRMNASRNTPPPVDGLMAATARVHRLALVTRNVAHVPTAGVTVVNPFVAG